jgi:SAM-dependent methyltransferase
MTYETRPSLSACTSTCTSTDKRRTNQPRMAITAMNPGSVRCRCCHSTQTRVCAHVSGVEVYRCHICCLCFCNPLPTVESDAAGTTDTLTEESFTADIQALSPERAQRYETLADERHRFYREKLGRESYRLLEIGCGTARLAEPLTRRGVSYEGIDIDPRPIDAARKRGATGLHCGDFREFPVAHPYDVIAMSQVLEHISDPVAIVDRLADSISPGGLVHVDVPNHGTLAGLPSRIVKGWGARYGAVKYPRHSIAYPTSALTALFARRFEVKVFTASPDDDLWGLGTVPTVGSKAHYVAQRLLRAGSIAIVVGRRND